MPSFPSAITIADAVTTNVDAGTDSPATARNDIKLALDLINGVKATVNAIIANGQPLTISGGETYTIAPNGPGIGNSAGNFDITSTLGKFRLTAQGSLKDINNTHPAFYINGNTTAATATISSGYSEFAGSNFDTSPIFNSNSNFNRTTGRFTATVAGNYEFTFYVHLNYSSYTTGIKPGQVQLRVNSNYYYPGDIQAWIGPSSYAEKITVTAKIVIPLAVGDYVSLWAALVFGSGTVSTTVKNFSGKLLPW